MGRPFNEKNARDFLERLRQELERQPAATTEELVVSTGVSPPTVRKYRKILQGFSAPRRGKLKFVPAAGSGRVGLRSGRLRRIRRPDAVVEVARVRTPPPKVTQVGFGFAPAASPDLPVEAAPQPSGGTWVAEWSGIREALVHITGLLESRQASPPTVPPSPELSASEKRWIAWKDAEEHFWRLYRSTGGVPESIQRILRQWKRINVQGDSLDFPFKKMSEFSPVAFVQLLFRQPHGTGFRDTE